jgi:AraC-like DNA-binding protein
MKRPGGAERVEALSEDRRWEVLGARGRGRRLAIELPPAAGRLRKVEVEGVLALSTGRAGGIGAVLSLCGPNGPVWSLRLVSGSHYSDCTDLTGVYRLNGDGSWVETVGEHQWNGRTVRVDRLSCEIPGGLGAKSLVLGIVEPGVELAVGAVRLEFADAGRCPFHSASDSVALSELGLVLRTANRPRFDQALEQLRAGMLAAEDDDEARSLGLTFIAVVGAAMLELGAPRSGHRAQLESAKELLAIDGRERLADAAVRRADALAAPVVPSGALSSDGPVQQALGYVDLHYADPLREEDVARRVGLSKSHFRYLFKLAVREPFHRYVLGRRLEAARSLLLSGGLTVTDVAERVGFSSPAHFSRAFAKRFNCPPSHFRRTGSGKTRQNSHYVA